MYMNRIAIIGCGALSRTLIRIVKEKLDSQYTISGVFSRNTENTKQTAAREHLAAYRSVQEMIEDRPDTIIELASADAVRDYGTLILQSGINLIVASTGALADQTLLA